MTKKEKVLTGLECCMNSMMFDPCPHHCPYYADCLNLSYAPLLADCMELLKEQPDVVQCEECKHYKDGFCYNPNTYDDVITCGNTAPDWYCADGKRREA